MNAAPRRRSLALLAGLLAAVSLLSAASVVLGNHTPRQEGKTWSLSTTTINVPNTDDGTHYNHWRCMQTTCRWGLTTRSNGGTLQRSCNVPYGGGDGSCQQYGHSAPAGSGFRWLSGGEHHYTTWPTPRTYAVAVCSRDIGEGAGKSAVDANGHPVKSSNSFCGVWTPTATTQQDTTDDDAEDDSEDEDDVELEVAQPTTTPPPVTVTRYGCRIGDPQATLAGLTTQAAKNRFNPYSWPGYRASNGWSWGAGVEEHPGPTRPYATASWTMASDAYRAPTASKDLAPGDTEMWFRAEVRNPTYRGSPPVREYPEGARSSPSRYASEVSIRGRTFAVYSDGRSSTSSGTCGVVRTRLAGLEATVDRPDASITYYTVTFSNGQQFRVPRSSVLNGGGEAWGTGAGRRVPPISEVLASTQHFPRSAAGVFKVAFGETEDVTYRVKITAVWEISISGVTAAGLAVKDGAKPARDFCTRTDTSGYTDGRGTCIREMKLSSEFTRIFPNRVTVP